MRRLLSSLVVLSSVLAASPALPAVFHVHPDGSDVADGSGPAPWQTIQHAANQVTGGDAVLIHPGIYRESVVLSASGMPEIPIILAAVPGAVLESPDPSASRSAFDVQSGVGHVVLLGIEARGGFHETIFVRSGAHDVRIIGCDIHDNRVGILIGGATDIVVDACHIHRNSVHGLRIAGESRDVTVRQTTSEANDDGFGCSGDADGFVVEEGSANVRFVECRAVANGEDGFDLQGDGIELLGIESRDNACAGIKLYQNARMENSLVTGNQTGVSTTSIFNPSVRIEIRNSTIADNAGTQLLLRGAERTESEPSLYTVSLRNVIAAGVGKAVEAFASVALEEDHNIFFRQDTTSGLIVRHLLDGAERRYSGQEINEGIWAEESGQGGGTFAIEPRFEPDGSYSVAATGAAIDSGSTDDAPALDRDGNARPAGRTIDIGPDELSVEMANHRPWADPGPDRVVVAGARLHLRAWGSVDPDGDPLIFEWDLGDASEPQTGYDVWHAYEQAGEYLVRLTASDGTLQHARTAVIQVLIPPTATATPTPTEPAAATPTPSNHDSEIRAYKRGKTIHLRARQRSYSRKIPVVVRNSDAGDDGGGHEIRVAMDVVGCPTGVTVDPPDFVRAVPGAQDRLFVQAGRRRRAIVVVNVDSDTIRAAEPLALECFVRFTAIGPGIDPTPANNVAELSLRFVDPERR